MLQYVGGTDSQEYNYTHSEHDQFIHPFVIICLQLCCVCVWVVCVVWCVLCDACKFIVMCSVCLLIGVCCWVCVGRAIVVICCVSYNVVIVAIL